MEEFDPDTVRKLVYFMYTGQYLYEKRVQGDDFGPLFDHIYVYSIADYYQVAKLKKKAKYILTNVVNENVSLEEFPKVVNLVYRVTERRDLRNLVLSTATDNLSSCVNLNKYKEADTMDGFEAECSKYLLNCCNRLSVLQCLPFNNSPEQPRKRPRSTS